MKSQTMTAKHASSSCVEIKQRLWQMDHVKTALTIKELWMMGKVVVLLVHLSRESKKMVLVKTVQNIQEDKELTNQHVVKMSVLEYKS